MWNENVLDLIEVPNQLVLSERVNSFRSSLRIEMGRSYGRGAVIHTFGALLERVKKLKASKTKRMIALFKVNHLI